MAVYKDICRVLKHDNYASEVYRFEGARTRSVFSINGDVTGDYIYFSKALDHHKYFSVKRIRQILNQLLIEELDMPLSNKTLHDENDYRRIKNFIIYSDSIKDMYSYKLIYAQPFGELIIDNFQYNSNKNGGTRSIERVDRRVYGGGYGVSCEWKELFQYLTFFSAKAKISRKDLLELLQNMKISGRMNRKDNISFLLGNDDRYIYEINPYLMSDFNKYNIINALEAILEKKMVLEASSLATSPKKCIKSVVEEYERGREKTLELLRKRY